ncbi:hypothetical protein C1T17_20740 (plasmid) [Sphingobium sp. SCG-1]|nr:hypothetical protein C1T17_20740 [Sphingobium sp. SCG-1]
MVSLGQLFTIDIAPAEHLVRVAIVGYWYDATPASFAAELERSVVQVGCGSQLFYLIDCRESSVQSAAVINQFLEISNQIAKRAQRVALVVSSTLLKL